MKPNPSGTPDHQKRKLLDQLRQAIRTRHFCLTHLAAVRRVSASAQNQALCAVLFLSKQVLNKDPHQIQDLVRAKKPKKLPVAPTKGEIFSVLEHHHHYNLHACFEPRAPKRAQSGRSFSVFLGCPIYVFTSD